MRPALRVIPILVAAAALAGNRPDAPGLRVLGQAPPGPEPRLFAPGVVSTELYERDVAITPDGKELYFTVVGPANRVTTIVVSRLVDGRWLEPEVASFSGDPGTVDIEPCITADGSRLYFVSTRPRPGKDPGDRNEDIWYVERAGEGWSEPKHLGAPVDSDDREYFPSITDDGTLYFTRSKVGDSVDAIYRSRLKDGRYQQPERLPDAVNAGHTRFNAYVAPDESYLILNIVGLEDAIGRSDYYAVFRSADDTWSTPVNLGQPVNVPGGWGYSAAVTHDGRTFFFMAVRPPETASGPRLTYSRLREIARGPGNGQPDIYWMDAAFIRTLRPAPLAK